MNGRISVVLFTIFAASALSLPAQDPMGAPAKQSVDVEDARVVLLGQIETANPKRPRFGVSGNRTDAASAGRFTASATL